MKFFASLVPSMIVTISGVLASAAGHVGVWMYAQSPPAGGPQRPACSWVLPLLPELDTTYAGPTKACNWEG